MNVKIDADLIGMTSSILSQMTPAELKKYNALLAAGQDPDDAAQDMLEIMLERMSRAR